MKAVYSVEQKRVAVATFRRSGSWECAQVKPDPSWPAT